MPAGGSGIPARTSRPGSGRGKRPPCSATTTTLRPRQRVLSADEIKAFWTKLPTADMAEPTRLALKLLLVTAQRRGELTFAKWSHFDLDGKVWTIPVELLKTGHARRAVPEPHVVP